MKRPRSRQQLALLDALRQARHDVGLSQTELADRLDKPQSYVAKYETGQRRLEVIEFLRIAGALKADPCVILRQLK